MAKLTVNLTNSTGTALSGANVTYACGDITGTVVTTNGAASISSLIAGNYTITGSMAGYTATSTSVTIGTDDTSVSIALPTSATASAENAAQKILDGTTATDWKTVKSAAEAAVSQLSTSVSMGNLADTAVLTTVYSQVTAVIQQAVSQVDAYKSQLMISRHTKGFWDCVLIDAKLVGITVFQRWLSAEITKLQKKLEDKLANI